MASQTWQDSLSDICMCFVKDLNYKITKYNRVQAGQAASQLWNHTLVLQLLIRWLWVSYLASLSPFPNLQNDTYFRFLKHVSWWTALTSILTVSLETVFPLMSLYIIGKANWICCTKYGPLANRINISCQFVRNADCISSICKYLPALFFRCSWKKVTASIFLPCLSSESIFYTSPYCL